MSTSRGFYYPWVCGALAGGDARAPRALDHASLLHPHVKGAPHLLGDGDPVTSPDLVQRVDGFYWQPKPGEL